MKQFRCWAAAVVMAGAMLVLPQQADAVEPGSMRADLHVGSRYVCNDGRLYCWDYGTKVTLADWPRGDLRIDYDFYFEGRFIGSDYDWCYGATGCTRTSPEQTAIIPTTQFFMVCYHWKIEIDALVRVSSGWIGKSRTNRFKRGGTC